MQYASSAWEALSLFFHLKKERTDHFDVHRISVDLAVNCYRLDAQLFRCAYYATSNFSAAAFVNNASKGGNCRLGYRLAIKILSNKGFFGLEVLPLSTLSVNCGIGCDIVNLPVVNVRPSFFIELEIL